MTLENKKNIFIELGKFLSQFSEAENHQKKDVLGNAVFYDSFVDLIRSIQKQTNK